VWWLRYLRYRITFYPLPMTPPADPRGGIMTTEYACGYDKQGNLRIVRVPKGMTLEKVKDLMEWALEPPYGTAYPIPISEVRTLAKVNRQDG
jgi:hypothetical protein